MREFQLLVFSILTLIVLALLIIILVLTYTKKKSSTEKFYRGSPPGKWSQKEYEKVKEVMRKILYYQLSQYLGAATYPGMRYEDVITKEMEDVVSCVINELSDKFHSGEIIHNLDSMELSQQFFSFIDGAKPKCGFDKIRNVVDYISQFLQTCGSGLTCNWDHQRKAAKCISENVMKYGENPEIYRACIAKHCPYCYLLNNLLP